MYNRNNEFIERNFPENQAYYMLKFGNLVKHCQADISQDFDSRFLKELFNSSSTDRAPILMFILINICDRSCKVYDAWINLLRECGLSQLEYEAFFGPGRQSEETNLFLKDREMCAGTVAASHILHQSCSDVPVWLWYTAILAESTTTAGNPHWKSLDQIIAAYRLAKVKHGQNAMDLFASRALVTLDWKSGPDIMDVPMDPIFMKGLLNHCKWSLYIKYCFAYAVVHGVDETTELVFQKLLKEYQQDTSAIERFCLEMLVDGYIPAAYVPDFEKVTAQLLELAN